MPSHSICIRYLLLTLSFTHLIHMRSLTFEHFTCTTLCDFSHQLRSSHLICTYILSAALHQLICSAHHALHFCDSLSLSLSSSSSSSHDAHFKTLLRDSCFICTYLHLYIFTACVRLSHSCVRCERRREML